MTNNIVDAVAQMTSLGFTDTEAALYCELVRMGPSTGYRLAQAISKAPANVYQSLANLASRGAVMVDDGDTKTFRATPPFELLSGLQRAFEASRTNAYAALTAMHAPTEDDRIYQLKTPDQIYARAIAMLNGAHEIVLFDLFPEPFERLSPLLANAHSRGVKVAGLTYTDTPMQPFAVARSRYPAEVADRWPGLQLSLIVDAREFLVALLSLDGLHARHGVWSDSTYLTCLQHSGMAAEIQMSMTGGATGPVPLSDFSLLTAYPAGLRTLIGPRRGDAEPGELSCATAS
jgi:sugar-specific transcriptional regulator TrmB